MDTDITGPPIGWWMPPATVVVPMEQWEEHMSEQGDTKPEVLDLTKAPARPFYRSTEWWLLVASLIFGGLLGSGVLVPGSTLAALCGMAVTALAALGYTIGRSIAKAAEGSGKPGWKTTEFWSSACAGALCAFQATHVIPAGSQAETLIAAVLTALPPLVYAIARGQVKANTTLVLIGLVALAGTAGCATWETTAKTVLGDLHGGLKVASQTGERVIGDKCRAEATACRDARRAAEAAKNEAGAVKARACAQLVACHGTLTKFNTTIIAGQLAVLDGLAAVGLGKAVADKDLTTIFERVRDLLSAAQRTIVEFGGRL